MRPLRLVPDNTKFDFVRHRFVAFAISLFVLLVGMASLPIQGLNLGLDFTGGLLVEVRARGPVDPAALRAEVATLDLGEIQLQQSGQNDYLIRVQRQAGDEKAQEAAIQAVRTLLGERFEYRRVDSVGPRVGDELFTGGMIATALALAGIALYVTVRFEWQFGVSALVATFHDVLSIVGLFSLFRIEFDLTAVAAILTLAGYSVNDTVVVFDRMREVLRRHKSADLITVINTSVNQTLSRTIMTSLTAMLAAVPLLLFGGPILFNFSLALVWGIIVGSYSSIFVAACLLLYMPPLARTSAADPAREAELRP
jgi:preprotein translocase subunit SecF